MAAPDSASLRWRKRFRYFVLSYVTNPTTISAMTEIPANTPSPMGKTESFLPGISNSAAVAEACSTAVPLASVVVLLASGAAVALASGAEVAAGTGFDVDSVVLGVGAGALDAGASVLDEAGGVEEGVGVEDSLGDDVESVMVPELEPVVGADSVGAAVDDSELLEEPGVAGVESVEEESVGEAGGGVAAVSVGVAVGVDDDGSELDDGAVAVGVSLPVTVLDDVVAGCPVGSSLVVHLETFSKTSSPAPFFFGVRVISQVSVIRPAAVSVVLEVVMVVDPSEGVAWRARTGKALTWAENKRKNERKAKNVD